jgi:hypothetical protein
MRQIVALILYPIVCILSAAAATQPIYINNSPVQVVAPPQSAPQIDATAFLNRSLFQVNDVYFTRLPYQTFNTRFFTNTSSGTILGDFGSRYEFSSGNIREPMYSWINQGTVSGDTFLLINATNIVSTGPLLTGNQGLMRLTGGAIKLSGNALRAGFGANGFTTGFNSVSNYLNPNGVTDVWWGAGTNNVVGGNGSLMRLDNGMFDVAGAGFQSAVHQVVTPGPFAFTNTISLPFFSGAINPGAGFGAYAFTQATSSTSSVVQVVFVRTNVFDTNLSVRVNFAADGDDGADALVEFSYPEFDIVDRAFTTNYFYFIDSTAFSTNVFLSKNAAGGPGKRPNTYNMVRSTAPYFGAQFASPPNTPYTPSLLYNSGYVSNVVPTIYAAYSASVSPVSVVNASGQDISRTTDPTNYPGRIEIAGNLLNLEQTRIRAETTVIIRAADLASDKLARIDAPYSVFDLTSHQPQMVISNFIPPSIQRLSGQLYAWSATWQNAQVSSAGTNTIKFHVLILDHFLQSAYRSQIYRLALHAPHLQIADPVAVGRSMILDARSMDVTGSLNLPAGANWANTNVVELYSLTNHGVITVPQTAMVGTDRPNPYDNYVNYGTNTAATHLIRARNIENSGSVVASSGLISINSETMKVAGVPPITNVTFAFNFTNFASILVTNIVGAKLQSSSDIEIVANDLVMSNAVFQTGANGGGLDLSIANRLSDSGLDAVSTWLIGGSLRLLVRPATGDLLGTHIVASVARNSEVFHAWAGEDRGAVPGGYVNNAAVAKLTLDAGDFSTIHFSPSSPATSNAIYVDYLELLNYATNVNSQLQIDPNFTIYFANANLEASKLDGASGGRLRWVKSFTGPLSSSTYTYTTTTLDGEPVYTTYILNSALAQDLNLDSDRDGTVNRNDPTPVYTGASIGLSVNRSKATPPRVTLQWNGFPGVTNRVEYRNSLTTPTWSVLTNVVPTGALTGPVTVFDLLPTVNSNAVERIYRVSVLLPP